MNKAYLFLRSRARWLLLIVAACFACYLAATAGMRARTIPAPPWADRGEPTNAVEILNYLDAVMACDFAAALRAVHKPHEPHDIAPESPLWKR